MTKYFPVMIGWGTGGWWGGSTLTLMSQNVTLGLGTNSGVELPTSPHTSKDKGGLVNLPNN